MRLQSVLLRNFRGVSESLIEFAPGVTIVSGPNEVGKSSVREAVRLVRDFKHSSKHQALRSVQPVGRDVGPEVELRLTSGPFRLRLAKRWLREAYTELEVHEPTHEQLSGDAAHERFQAILAETVDLDLLHALDVAQGTSLERPALAEIAALHAALDDTGERAESGDGADVLLERIEQEYARYFTPSGRPTGDYRALAAALPDLEETVRDLRGQSRAMDERTNDYERQARQLAADEEQIARAGEQLEQWLGRDRGLTELRERLRRRQEELAEAERVLAEADAAVAARRELTETVTECAARVTDLQQELVDLTDAAQQAGRRREAAQAEATRTGEVVHAARRRASRATQALSRAQDAAELAELERRLERARAAEAQRIEATARIEAARVDPPMLERLTELGTQVSLARRTREAAAARLVIHRLGEAPVTVGQDQVEGVRELRATGPVTIEAPGVLRLEVEPGAGPADLTREVTLAEESLEAALREAGVGSLEEARGVAAERGDAVAARDRAVDTLDVVLGGGTLPELAEHVAAVAARLAPRPDDPDEPADPGGPRTTAAQSVDVERLRAAVDAAEREVDEAERDADEAGGQLESERARAAAAHDSLLRVQVALDEKRRQHEAAQQRLDRARAVLTDEEVAGRASAAAAAAEQATSALEGARAELTAADADRVELELANARAALESARERLAGTKERLVRVRTLLEESTKLGIYDRLAAAEAELEAARSAHERMDRSARAIALLRETMHRHRDAAHRRYVAPFKASIDRLGRIVFGREFEVHIDEDLQIASRTLDGDTVPFESLSAGAREQLALLGRLACAQLVDAQEGAPVILDDALGFADADRLRALNVVLATVGREAQVILFTCQEERFTGIGGAATVRLPTV